MTRLINLDDEVIVLYANETKAKVFNEENNGEDFKTEAGKFFNELISEPTKKELLQEKLQDEYLDDMTHEERENEMMAERGEFDK